MAEPRHPAEYAAFRLGSHHLVGTISRLHLITTFTLLLILQSSAKINTNPRSPWQTYHLSGSPENIVTDEKNDRLFIAVNGDVHLLSNKLELVSSLSTGDSRAGHANSNTNKLLSTIRKNDQDFLLSCWQNETSNINCLLSKANKLNLVVPLRWSNGNKGFKSNANQSIRVLVDPIDNYDLVFASSRPRVSFIRDQNNSSQDVSEFPAISRFRIAKNRDLIALEQKSVLPYKNRLNNYNLFYDYIYLFDYDQHTHFILNDIQESPQSKLHRVRLARICNNDTDLTSYTEISISCNSQDGLHALAAHFETNTSTLYIAFQTLDSFPGSRGKDSITTVCLYTMKLINDIFYQAISDCNHGNQASNLLAKSYEDSDFPPLCQKSSLIPENWCIGKTNLYIDGTSHKVIEESSFIIEGVPSVNFIYPMKHSPQAKEVLFVGSEFGFLTKMCPDEEEKFFTIDFNRNEIQNHRPGQKINLRAPVNISESYRPTKYSISGRNVLVATGGGTLSKVESDACYYYTSCKACLTTTDPLFCGWCGSSCSRKNDCELEKQSRTSCPPVITKFSPSSGPISGQTRLKIEGDNFGSVKGELSVTLGENVCNIDRELTSETEIICHTKPVVNSIALPIGVQISDESGPVYSKGSTESKNVFFFLPIEIYGLYPSSGLQNEIINITIYGEHLDSGSDRSVIIGNSNCAIIKLSGSEIVCSLTVTSQSEESNSSNQTLPLRVLVDGQEQPVVHKETYKGRDLSRWFMISPLADDSMQSTGDTSRQGFSSVIFITIAFALLIIVTIGYFLKGDKMVLSKIKKPKFLDSCAEKDNSSTRVTFRNPQSHKFITSSSTVGTDSLTGLVKLNGSVMSSDYFSKHEQPDVDRPLIGTNLDSEMLSYLAAERILIDRNRLTLGHVLGSGQFGRVYKGFLKDEKTGEHEAVAVKTLHSRSSWDDCVNNRAFLDEGIIMKDFEHENVLALIGVTFDSNGLPMVITPFMLYGDLRSYIMDETCSPTVKELIDFGTQIARGMAYLSNLKFVHRDLAARNCMLDENLNVKVADFGLSRDIYERDYYSSDNRKTKLPVKWMAIESLEKCIYNTKTDVWSYGVLLWELMTRGVVPYPDVDNFDLFKWLKEGRRMMRPKFCPLILYKIMLSCWDENPNNRPSFDELVISVSEVITQLRVAKDGQQKVSRDVTYCDASKAV